MLVRLAHIVSLAQPGGAEHSLVPAKSHATRTCSTLQMRSDWNGLFVCVRIVLSIQKCKLNFIKVRIFVLGSGKCVTAPRLEYFSELFVWCWVLLSPLSVTGGFHGEGVSLVFGGCDEQPMISFPCCRGFQLCVGQIN